METIINNLKQIWLQVQRTIILVVATLMVLGPVFVLSQTASAAQVTTRSVTISTSIPSATANYVIAFNPNSTTQIESYQIQACLTALGSCTAPTGLNISAGTPTNSGFQGATAFTKDTTSTTGTYACNTTNILCGHRTDVTAQTTATQHVITDTGVTNPSGADCSTVNCTFFLRIYTYSDVGYLTQVDYGTTAASTTQTLSVNAAIQEQLAFCIGATTINDGTTAPGACSGISGTSVNLGTLSNTAVSVSPVPLIAYNGNGDNGIAQLSTNASNGASISYSSIQQSGTNHLGTLRVAGATCNAGAVVTDQCINTIGTTKATIAAGTENFGMAISAVNCGNVTSAYTCSFSAGNFNLDPATNYNCNGIANGAHANTYPSDTNQVSGTTACSYAWDETGTSQTIASSTTIVGGEALILKFAATPNLVTPTGAYTAQASFIATPTF
jgi:hypothetical protein